MEIELRWLCMLVYACYTMLSFDTRIAFGARIDLSADDEARYERGKAKLMELQRQTRYGPCWTAALESLETGCRQLTEDVQHELTLKFVECFMLKTGRPFEACDDVDRVECTRRMSPEVFSTYTEFFTHTQSICFYLQAREWQIATEYTIDRLTDSSADVVQKLESAEGIQHELLRKQNDSVHIQQQLLDDGAELQQTLQESKVDVQAMMQEFQTAVSEQKNLKDVVFEVIHRVQALQSIVTGEFMGFYSLIFYLLSLVIAYLLTSMPRTSGARFWLFLILSVNVVVERMIVMWADVGGQLDPLTGHPADENTILFFQLRTCRKCFITVAVGVWCWIAYRFRDINDINNRILMQVQQQNAEIKELIQTHGSPVYTSHGVFDTPDTASTQPISTGHNPVGEINVSEGVEMEAASGLHADENKVSLADEPAPDAVQHSTPATDMAHTRPLAVSDQPVRAAGRRRRTDALSSSQLTPSTRRYNLRSRVRFSTPQPADELSVEVRRLADVSERNRVRALHAVEHAYNRFSSDED